MKKKELGKIEKNCVDCGKKLWRHQQLFAR